MSRNKMFAIGLAMFLLGCMIPLLVGQAASSDYDSEPECICPLENAPLDIDDVPGTAPIGQFQPGQNVPRFDFILFDATVAETQFRR